MGVDRGAMRGNRRMIGKFHAFRKACAFGSSEAVKKSRAARVTGAAPSDASRRDAGDAGPSLRSGGEADGGAPPVTLRAGGGCAAISASLVVSDATASPPPRSLISQRKLHRRGPLWISS